MVRLENVWHAGGDVERDVDIGGGGLPREADRFIEENLVSSDLDDEGRQAGQVSEDGADQPGSGVPPPSSAAVTVRSVSCSSARARSSTTSARCSGSST